MYRPQEVSLLTIFLLSLNLVLCIVLALKSVKFRLLLDIQEDINIVGQLASYILELFSRLFTFMYTNDVESKLCNNS